MFSNSKDWAQRAAALRHQLQDAWREVQEDDGLLFTKNFVSLLRKLRYQPKTARANKQGYVPATDVEVAAALQAMGMTQYHIQDGVFLRYSTMVCAPFAVMVISRQVRQAIAMVARALTSDVAHAGKMVPDGHARRARGPSKYSLAPAWTRSRPSDHLHASTRMYTYDASGRQAACTRRTRTRAFNVVLFLQVDTAHGDANKHDGVTVWALVHNEYSKASERDEGLWDHAKQTFPGTQPHPSHPSVRPGSSFRRIKQSATFGRQSGQHVPIADVVEYRALPHFKAGLELALQPTTATMYAPGAENKRVPGRLPPPRPTRSSLALAESNRYRFAHLQIEGHAAQHAKPFDHHAAMQASVRPQSARW